MTGVFVNYRGMARSYAPMLVCTTLQRRFGPGLVFEAAHDNQPGVHFERSIEGWLERCSLLIACIDHAWIADQAKLRDPGDWVRREIEYCIEHDKPILPILLDGAEMPHRADLPAELGGLTRWIGLGMASTTVYADLERLVGRVEALAPELVLAALHQPPAGPVAPVGPAALLRAEHEVFPYRPQPELESLAAWAADPAGPPLRVVTGPAAAGKTRLALRLGDRLRAAGHPAVLLPAGTAPKALVPLAATTTRCLVVLDDAHTRPDTVAAAVRAVATGGSAARILLLARSSGDWLDRLRDDPDDRIADVLDRAGADRLEPPATVPGDFATARAALARRLGLDAPPGGAPPPATTLIELQAAALADLVGGPAGASPWARLAEVERSRWVRAATGFGLPRLTGREADELMAAVSLFGADTDATAEALLASLRAFNGAPVADRDAGLALARTMLPGPRPLNPLAPAPLADEIVARLLRRGYRLADLAGVIGPDQARAALVGLGRGLAANPDLGGPVSDLLATAPARFMPAAMTAVAVVPDPRPLAAAMIGSVPAVPLDALEPLVDALPQRSDVLAPFAAELTARALAARRAAGPDDAGTARLARLLAVRLAALGDHTRAAEAVTAARSAVAWLKAAGSDEAELAEAYAALALAHDLGREGDPGEAEAAASAGARAIGLLRPLTGERAEGALVTALVNQVHRRHERALAEEAYAVAVRLHVARPTRFRSLLADAADNLAVLAGDPQVGREALRLRRELAAARPDAYRSQLAVTLFNIGGVLRAAGAEADGRALREESAAIAAELLRERGGGTG